MFLFDITINFDKACASLIPDDPELLRFVKNHERKNLVLNNLCKQVLQVERQLGSKITPGVRNNLILEVARMFVEAAKKAHEKKQMSAAELTRQSRKSEPFEEMGEILKDGGGKVFTNGVLTEVD